MSGSGTDQALNIPPLPHFPGQSTLQEDTGVLPVVPSAPDSSFRARWAALAITKDLGRFQTEATNVPTDKAGPWNLLPISGILSSADHSVSSSFDYKVGIVGAGVAGMFTAMIFDYLKEKYGLNVDYDILEAEKSASDGGRGVGGRLYTHHFKQTDSKYPIGPHDYYDVGAMRFPDTEVMARTFQLFKTVGMTIPKGKTPEPGDLIPYYWKGVNQPVLFNGIQVVQHDSKPPLSAETFKIPNIPENVRTTDAGALHDVPIQWILDIHDKQGPEAFWNVLKTDIDPYTTRQYFKQRLEYDYNTIEFMETLDFGNRWYDQAASEDVLETLDFNSSANWYCIEGGSSLIAANMQKSIKQQKAFSFDTTVTAISYTPDTLQTKIDVTMKVSGNKEVRTYDAVFNSATLGAMQHMELEGLKQNWGTKLAIRDLGYGASCKVGVRFKTLWWKDPKDLAITKGGVGKTDLPIGFCVYPSYNVEDPVDAPGVLLVSYSWSQQAERIGSLISRDSPNNEQELRALITHDLARLHSKTDDEKDYQRIWNLVNDNWLDHHAYNWYDNPRMCGAFAFFGPQQFTHLYNDLTASDGRYMIIGEASSAHHAWVVGALESAVRGVYQFLCTAANPAWPDSPASRALEAYNSGNVPGPYGPLPVEFNRPKEVKIPSDVKANVVKAPEVGELARMGVLLEQIRLRQGGDVVNPKDISKDELAPILGLLSSGSK